MDAQFTKQFPLTKTLRFELKPYGKTAQLLEDSGVIKTDEKRSEDFKELKKQLDDVYRHFIEDALARVELPIAELQAFEPKEKAKHATHAILRKYFLRAFADTNKEWQAKFGLKKDPLSPEAIIKVMHALLPETAELAKQFEKFTTYLGPFNENRQHIFKDDGKASQIATRAIEENLPIFLTNIERAGHLAAQDVACLDEYSQLFNLEDYGRYLSQSKIDTYNTAIGEINRIIHEHRQSLEKSEKNKVPLLRYLYKQILSDRAKFIDLLEDDEQLAKVIAALLDRADDSDRTFEQIIQTFFESELNLGQVYIKRTALNTMGNAWFGDWAFARGIVPKQGDRKQSAFVAVSEILLGFEGVEEKVSEAFNVAKQEIASVVSANNSLSDNFWNVWKDQLLRAKAKESEKRRKAKGVSEYKTDESKEVLKDWLDERKAIEQMLRWWQLEYQHEEVTDLERDESFYLQLERFYGTSLESSEERVDFFDGYNKIRNYLTKKPYSLDKWKLNFDASNFLGGWDKNKESECLGVFLTKDDHYFLAIINKKEGTKVFEPSNNPSLYSPDSSGWQKIDYKFMPTPNKMLPKVFFAKGNLRTATNTKGRFDVPNGEILRIREEGTFKKANFVKSDLNKWIDFMKLRLSQHEEWCRFNFQFKDTVDYVDVSEFYFDVAKGAYKLELQKVNDERLNEMIDNGLIYLFELTNKDFQNKNTSSRQNLHTLYLRRLFSAKNIQDDVKVKLNGAAEIFFRPKSFNIEKERRGGVEVIRYKRFTRDIIQFHLPLTLNFGTREIRQSEFNDKLNETSKGVARIIGIDRGEKNLAYVAICDESGKLLEAPKSLNILEGIDYYKILTERTKERADARKEWKSIQAIKDLKAGFVGHAAKYIADLAIKHNAFIALEDLNYGFKRGRLKIEHSNYQKFESALLHKLQYYVDKALDADEPGGSSNGIQWAPPKVESGDIKGVQFGRVLFVKAAYTSAIDPVTGFRRCFNLDEKMPLGRVLDGIDQIYYDQASKSYLFVFSWAKLAGSVSVKSKNAYPSKMWTVTADVERLRFKKNAKGGGEIDELNPSALLHKLLKDEGVDAESNDTKAAIFAVKTSASFRRSFYFIFNLITQLRNANSETNDDFILSPVVDGFDSRKGYEGHKWDGDANGALNIARKGAIALSHIRNSKSGDKLDWQKLNSDAAWDEWFNKT